MRKLIIKMYLKNRISLSVAGELLDKLEQIREKKKY